MASLKDLRGRINSVKSTRKITQAMKRVAAAKLRRYLGRKVRLVGWSFASRGKHHDPGPAPPPNIARITRSKSTETRPTNNGSQSRFRLRSHAYCALSLPEVNRRIAIPLRPIDRLNTLGA